ncbi:MULTISPECIES: transglycosylase domain-containing protein [Prauserella salsuginis group]|uniref:Membrane peptidoglycan carboxypeptidase n=2 Tax=Prauserella salsuginis group TaxID=2893672 RepID=A0A839XGZ8_9PSEU|nr:MULTISPECIES: transglycosylase domain-containing protein [Prauserella salsuginis group]MBB3663242.1 membrane peptidoglycan carboxypeptidase [Prauserella sediminis]MCR3720931.1 Membrane carboxypeptidase (penicillin-binding protein) [Prauserella flava]MCR3734988.1 Membrane carboxypeptidase (penicillin-binding protein) [Prauserella salsuginis]
MRKRSGLLKLVGLCLLAGVLVAGILFPVVGAAGVVSNQASETVESMSAELADEPPPQLTTVTDKSGKPIATLYNQYRVPTKPDQISDAMKWALISIEDRRFYEHTGVDWKGTLRAAISNSSGGDTQGASTLTQQYVKNYLINVTYRDDEIGQQRAQEQTIARKLKEARIAIQLETRMSKDEILAGYLNVVEFSRQIYGVGGAARAYFNTTPDKLDVGQSAMLAGMVNNPAVLDPWNNPEGAKNRRNMVLDSMVDNRKLSAEDAERIKKEPLGVAKGGPNKPAANCVGAGPEHGFFCQYVEDYLIRSGISKEDLYDGGYTIRTTLDRRINRIAKRSAEEQVPKMQENIANTLAMVRPGKKRHEVVALAANRDYGLDKEAGQTTYALPSDTWNVTGAGSSYKIFTAAAAMEHAGVGIFDSLPSPGSYTARNFSDGTNPYTVGNAGEYPASMTLQDALAKSPNTTFVHLVDRVGMKPVLDMAYKLGMRRTMQSNAANGGPVDPDADSSMYSLPQRKFYGPRANTRGIPSFTLGVSPTNPLEMSNVAATILSGGTWCPPTPVAEVTDRNGDPVKIDENPCQQVVNEDLANSLAVGMSKDDLPGGTSAAAAEAVDWSRPMIGKTGTTQNNASGAFIGGTPQLAGASMIFKPERPTGGIVDSGPGNVYSVDGEGNIFGGKAPARTWFNAMKKIMEGEPVRQLPKPSPRYE